MFPQYSIRIPLHPCRPYRNGLQIKLMNVIAFSFLHGMVPIKKLRFLKARKTN
jgi:hypothetical protein